MKFPVIGAIIGSALVLAATVSLSLAAPAKVEGVKGNQAPADEIVSRMGHWDATDLDDFTRADKVVVFTISGGTYDGDDYNKIVAAESNASMLTAMHKAIADNAEVAKWFKDNGYDVNDVRAIIHHTENNSFEVYLH